MALNVSSKVALVTGGGSGISFSFAKLLLSKNCSVLIADLALRPEAEQLIKEYSNSTQGPKAKFQRTDVTDWKQLEEMFTVAQREFGGVDIICPGAGVYDPPFSNFWMPPGSSKSRDDPWGSRYTTMDINVTHPIRCTQMAISHFIKQKRPGVVVHISSIAAQKPILQCPLYTASKYAISGFVKSLAELETPADKRLPSIRVNAVAPGVIKTPLWTENPEKLQWIDEAKDEWVEPMEVAEIMLDLVQKDEYVGGTILEVGKNHVRPVETLNDPGPKGPGLTVSASGKGKEEVWQWLMEMSSPV